MAVLKKHFMLMTGDSEHSVERISYFTRGSGSEMARRTNWPVKWVIQAEELFRQENLREGGKVETTNISLLCIKHCPTHWVYSVKKIESDLLEVIA